MKSNFLILIFAMLCIACDSHDLISDTEAVEHPEATMLKRGETPPFHSANVYDYAGQVHSDIFNSYYDLPPLPTSLDSVVALVTTEMAAHDYFKGLSNYHYNAFTTATVDSIIQYPTVALETAIDASSLSLTAKGSLKTFIDDLFLKVNEEEDYADVYDFILDYEVLLIDSIDYRADEKEFILTVTSIARHSIYNKEKKPKQPYDPDWDWLTTCIVGSVKGAGDGVPEAIDMALKAGIGAE